MVRHVESWGRIFGESPIPLKTKEIDGYSVEKSKPRNTREEKGSLRDPNPYQGAGDRDEFPGVCLPPAGPIPRRRETPKDGRTGAPRQADHTNPHPSAPDRARQRPQRGGPADAQPKTPAPIPDAAAPPGPTHHPFSLIRAGRAAAEGMSAIRPRRKGRLARDAQRSAPGQGQEMAQEIAQEFCA